MLLHRHGIACVLMILSISVASGCVEQASHPDGTQVFQFQRWVALTALAGALAAVPVAWMLRRRMKKITFIALGVAPVAMIIVVPGLWRDRAAVNDHGFSLDTGLWFAPSQWNVRFEDVESIRHVSYVDCLRGLDQKKYKLILKMKSGSSRTVPSGDLMRHAVPTVLETARRMGIEVRDETVNK